MLTLAQAQKMTKQALSKADEIGIAIAVTVVDAHGAVLSTQRMEQSLVVSAEFALAKAYTSAVLGMPTKDIAQYAVPGNPYYGTTSMFGGKFMVIAGGLPIMKDGKVIGGIGVGGSADVSQDVACAEAALAEKIS